MPENGSEPVSDGGYVQRYLSEIGFDRIVDEVAGRGGEPVRDSLRTFGTAVAVSDLYKQEGIEPIEIGGWAVFSHLFDVEGVEAFLEWRGSHDSDKYFQAYDDIRGPIERSGLSARPERTPNPHHLERGTAKYTARLKVTPGSYVEIDFMQPEVEGEEDYTLEQATRIPVADSSITVPTVEKMLVENAGDR